MAAVFQNGCYGMKIILTVAAKLLEFSDLYIHQIIMFLMMPNLILTFKNGLDGPIPIYLRISAISQEGKPPCLVNLHSDAVIACDTSM